MIAHELESIALVASYTHVLSSIAVLNNQSIDCTTVLWRVYANVWRQNVGLDLQAGQI